MIPQVLNKDEQLKMFRHEATRFLPRKGFIHVTGLRPEVSNGRPIAFPRAMWGSVYRDGLGEILLILSNGEVWWRCGTYDIWPEWQKDPMVMSVFRYLCGQDQMKEIDDSFFIRLYPRFFQDLRYIDTYHFPYRAAEPYCDFHGACVVDPQHYITE